MGGCLTPIGDPPLLMGFAGASPFFWSLRLFPVLAFNAVILLAVFYWIDMRAYRKDIANGNMPDIRKPGTEIRIRGLHNLLFLAMIVAAVVLSGILPTWPVFQDGAGNVLGLPIFGEVTLTLPAILKSRSSCWPPCCPSRPRRCPCGSPTTSPGGPSGRWPSCSWASSSPCSPP